MSPPLLAAASLADVHAALAQLHGQHAAVSQQLAALAASHPHVARALARADVLRARAATQAATTRAVRSGMLAAAAATATRISAAVRRVDGEHANVRATLAVVEQVAELKACVLGVHRAMGAAQDWEAAAGHLSRASKLPPAVVASRFADDMVPTADVPDPPRLTLHAAAESLCALFLRDFDRAAAAADGPAVTRFFKLFPLIARADVGLDAYGRYVCQGVAARARAALHAAPPAHARDAFFYANAVTQLFEHIAHIVDGHAPLVERHYGPGAMAKVVQRLQGEADVQAGIVLDTWHHERRIDRALTDIKSYAFSFLVQSFLPAQKPAAATPRSRSPATPDPHPARASEHEGVSMKELDALLAESALMLAKCALYSRFISDKCASPQPQDAIDHGLVMPEFLATSNLHKKVSTHLVEPFNAMTTFSFRRSVEKAFQLDESPTDLTLNPTKPLGSNPPFITSAVDDVMYIVNQVLQRTLATSQRAIIASVEPTITRVLGSDFIGMIQRKMRDESYPKPVIQGGLPPEDKVIAFLVLLNNLDVSNDYIKRIIDQQLNKIPTAEPDEANSPLQHLYPFGHDAVYVEGRLKALQNAFISKSSELINDGITVLFTNVLKPRIRPILAEAFRDIDYAPPQDEDMQDDEEEDVDLVKSRFDRGWGIVIRPIKRILTSTNFDRLLTLALNYLASALEKRIRSYYGRVNELGAVRLERDIAGITTAAVTGGKYGLRDAFAKCTQMTLIMNMEDDEWDQVVGDNSGESGIAWVLDAEERRRRGIISWISLLPLALAQCPVYTHYSAQRHEPFSTGRHQLSYMRPIPPCRTFYAQEVEETIQRLKDVIVDPDLFRLFENSWPSTLDTTVAWRGWSKTATGEGASEKKEELSFVITSDIEAIFDSLAGLFRGAINLQARYIIDAPFCNAFQAPEESGIPRRSSRNSDTITPYFDYYKVFSCQWELDSVAAFLQLSADYATATHDYEFFQKSSNWTKAVDTILRTAESMMIDSYDLQGNWQHTPYTYCAPYGGTPINNCNGAPHRGNIGLVRSFHRPSDDACTYQYLIPSNMMFSAALNASSLIMSRITPRNTNSNLTSWMRDMSTGINRGILDHAILSDPKHGKIYAFEIDGYGAHTAMDDPNIPSLLSAPYLSYTTARDPIYINTRRKILSRDNPYFSASNLISGVTSQHTLPGNVWPMANIMAILTSEDDVEMYNNLKMVLQSTGGLGLVHESIDVKRRGDMYTRAWFSWANGLLGQAVLGIENKAPWVLGQSFQ
ncbi:Six-hairpin glycosidase-like protein [Ampelomyces quisqualis]|uniref:Conserved oligomeric Golgi complex subunit 4 n=1 Tax=Ampelomyces quisqualis TaxID=50730 RepID=A0A6A5QKL1_AMPQU|nr:Six-hairpin glycosidase-like protein [Ampelomyces quisqualis]